MQATMSDRKRAGGTKSYKIKGPGCASEGEEHSRSGGETASNEQDDYSGREWLNKKASDEN